MHDCEIYEEDFFPDENDMDQDDISIGNVSDPEGTNEENNRGPREPEHDPDVLDEYCVRKKFINGRIINQRLWKRHGLSVRLTITHDPFDQIWYAYSLWDINKGKFEIEVKRSHLILANC
jgi:hypothetical protein